MSYFIFKHRLGIINRITASTAKNNFVRRSKWLIFQYAFILCLLLGGFISQKTQAQEKKTKVSQNSSRLMNLNKSLELNENDSILALKYKEAALEAQQLGNLSLAERYAQQAKTLYIKQKQKNKLADIERLIAILQEDQNRIDDAILSYQKASNNSTNLEMREVNKNDALRLQNANNPKEQTKLIKKNIALFDTLQDVENNSKAQRQLAETNLKLNQNAEAISNLDRAFETTQEPKQKIEISENLSQIYSNQKQYSKAIDASKTAVEEAEKTGDIEANINQLKSLSSILETANNSNESIIILEEAYNLAKNRGFTLEAINITKQIAQVYINQNQTKKAITQYNRFLEELPTILSIDSTLHDAHVYELLNERVSQLEESRAQAHKIASQKTILNYGLLIILGLLVLGLVLAAKTVYSIKRKNKKIALQSLRREMNPHFIFNSLNSVNQYIAQNDELKANQYLTSYSKLMRNIMVNSNNDFISLSVELIQLKEYLELEHLRFIDKFTYQIQVDESLDTDALLVPNMLIQPQLENAIWHGLRYIENKGMLTLNIQKENSRLVVTIEDNGIGLKKSAELKTTHQKKHQSRGFLNTKERIKLLNDLYNTKIILDIIDKTETSTGVIVVISFPITFKKY